ncbi:MAG TPA: 16S rRNA (guanine(966)-N(2))-methyltransferase RsmD [Bryobacterales bacterium]|jgi:16S rRNA (guanine966-N2)-methyltransferase|nr:16S rRNA (guanine(966)-N(2))-methyltransferase RsmD [Bryobacterales bacterium]
MRVIGGTFRSRHLKTVPRDSLRPTSDRLRETLFDVLGAEVEGKVFVDAYAGSGAVGIEALSRGAARAIFIESNRKAAAVLRQNLRELGLETRSRVIERPASRALANIEADILFVDPPYANIHEYQACLSLAGQSAHGGGGADSFREDASRQKAAKASGTGHRARVPGLVIAEHSSRIDLAPVYGKLQRTRVLKQGDSSLSFYRPRGSEQQ